jgi:phenylalanyl-tRNA synthetase beta chain
VKPARADEREPIMKISYRWVREFVDTELGPRELSDRLINAGIEVASIAPVVEGLAGVLVAEIQAVERDLGVTVTGHHNTLCRVALPTRTFAVVCGAPNAIAGLRTAFAPPGATLPGHDAVNTIEIRGVTSEGVLCSEKDLGLSDAHHELLALPQDAPLGADLLSYLGLDDWILEIEITPNRPDVLSIVGVAREIAALTGAPFYIPPIPIREGGVEASRLASVVVEAPDLCPRFGARVITGLRVQPSPPWLAQRLRAVSLRPINNLVDITNYVMWELGQPLHAFDLDRVAGRSIIVRRARPGERIVTLDGQTHALAPDMAMVCDAERAIGIGGVMGGADSEVTEQTTSVLLEAAYWDPGSVRRTSRALGLATDAAYRFERGGDIEGLRQALDRAAQLMAELGGGMVARGILDVYPAPRRERRIRLRMSRIERLIGASPSRNEAVGILRALGLGVDDSAADLHVTVPSFRRDLGQEDDLVEEIVRVWGYDNIPLTLDRGGSLVPVTRPPALRLARAVAQALTAAGLFECITYAFVDPDRLAAMGWSEGDGLLALTNPLSRERSALRPSMIPGLLEALATNATRQVTDARVFEIGHVFMPRRHSDGDRPAHEELWVGIALTGLRQPRGWYASRERADIYDAKGMAEQVLAAAGATDVEVAPWPEGRQPRYLEPGRGARFMSAAREVGVFGELSVAAREAFDLSSPVYIAEVSLSLLLDQPASVPRHQPLPRYPAVQRDLALVVPAEVTAGEIEAAIRALRLPLLTRLVLFDVYTGDQVTPGHRSLAWSLTFQAGDRTLRDAEVNELHARIVRELGERFKAEIRAT